ncbi:MAG: hypothetical protein LUQ59_03720 [Methanothrix sp.]|nr:hypothetical protein [Methanothrix sp.]
MKFKTSCILAAAIVLCIIIVPAMSQGDDRAGMNGMQGNGMGPAEDHAFDTFQDSAPLGQGNGQAPPDDEKKFKGCNTMPKKMKDKKPIDKPAPDKNAPDKPEGFEGAPSDNPGQAPGVGEFGIGPADPNRPRDLRSILPGSPHGKAPAKNPMKSIMKDWHMKNWHKKTPRPLMENYFQAKPPVKSIMDHQI